MSAADPAAAGTVLVTIDGPLMRMVLSNPGARNALSPSIYDAGLQAIAQAGADPAVRAVLLHGADGFFCAGGNLNRLNGNRQREPQVQRDAIERMHQWIAAIRQCPKPIVAAVEGAAAGAGFSLALACDLIVAGRDARFVMSYARVGLSPDGGASAALAAALAPQRAFAILALCEPVSSTELLQAGVVHEQVDAGQAVARAEQLALQLAQGPTAVYARIKALLQSAVRAPFAQQLEGEREAFVASLFDADAGEGINAFLEKRKPRFSGR